MDRKVCPSVVELLSCLIAWDLTLMKLQRTHDSPQNFTPNSTLETSYFASGQKQHKNRSEQESNVHPFLVHYIPQTPKPLLQKGANLTFARE